VRAGLLHVYERWNGKGGPNEIAGESIALTSRIAQVALTVSLFHALGGPMRLSRPSGSGPARRLTRSSRRWCPSTRGESPASWGRRTL
jgi:response regulator RpfG family c-di-GMP phosphodiesterase